MAGVRMRRRGALFVLWVLAASWYYRPAFFDRLQLRQVKIEMLLASVLLTLSNYLARLCKAFKQRQRSSKYQVGLVSHSFERCETHATLRLRAFRHEHSSRRCDPQQPLQRCLRVYARIDPIQQWSLQAPRRASRSRRR